MKLKVVLDRRTLSGWTTRLEELASSSAADYLGDWTRRQPVHTVYGGAHLFNLNTASRLGELALTFLDRWVPGPDDLEQILDLTSGISNKVYALIRAKLEREPVEDFRIDFEDGYGYRPDDEEDAHARAAALGVAAGMSASTLPPYIGIRIKPLTAASHMRALRTLELFVRTLTDAQGELPTGFTVTLPKVENVEQVSVLCDALAHVEEKLGLVPISIELMAETPQIILARNGSTSLQQYLDAGSGRVRAVHLGVYDYTAALDITASGQTLDHPAVDFARRVLQVAAAGTGIWLSDGATNVLPVPIHRGTKLNAIHEIDNRTAIHEAMRMHYRNVRASLSQGYYQSWDLHPSQLPARYAAVYAFFVEDVDQAVSRLSSFVESAARATMVGDVFDDAATGQGLINFFLRAVNCGALTEEEVSRMLGITVVELRSRSFLEIVGRKRTREA